MAHTPLLRTLRRMFRERRALRGGAPLPGRRAFLAGAAATAALTALPASASRGGASVAVVGAGIAGLTCALELRQHGIDATVYEASGRVGGRMFTLARHWDDGQLSEWGGELIDSGHHTIRNLAMRYGLKLDNLLKAQPAGSEDTYVLDQAYYSKARADADFGAVYDAVSADLGAAGYPTTFESSTPEGRKLDKLSVADWIDTRVPGGRRSPMGKVLELAYVIEYGADADDQSALNLVYLLGYQPDGTGKHFNVFGVSDEAYHIRGGNEQLPRAMADELGEDAIRTGYRLERLTAKGGGYLLSFGREEVAADWVVLALPFSVLAEVDLRGAGFDDLKRAAINELGRGLNGKTQLQFAERTWNGPGRWPGVSNGSSYSDTGYQAGWEATRGQAGRSGILVFYSGGSPVLKKHATTPFATESDPGVAADAVDALHQAEPVFPGLTWARKATQSLPHLSPLFRASYAYYKPGQYQRFGGYEGRRQGGVLFCGEHTSQDFQGFMEGGASEGLRAARELSKLI